jgi:hypothetical protein
MQRQVVAQDVEQRRIGICFDDSRLAIHFQRDSRHGEIPFSAGWSDDRELIDDLQILKVNVYG